MNTEHEHFLDNEDDDFGPSKTQIKQEQDDIKNLGRQLVELTPAEIKSFSLSPSLTEALLTAKNLSRAALQRQYKFIRKLLNKEDLDEVRHQLNILSGLVKIENKKFHQLECWRDQLIEGNNETLEDIALIYPEIDRQYIRQLIRNTQKERANEKPLKSAKQLFKYLRELTENN